MIKKQNQENLIYNEPNPEYEFDTLAGFVLHQLEHIPVTGEKFEWRDFNFEIIDMDGQRIDKILVKIQQKIELDNAIKNNLSYICSETLTNDLQLVQNLSSANASKIEVDELISTLISIEKLN